MREALTSGHLAGEAAHPDTMHIQHNHKHSLGFLKGSTAVSGTGVVSLCLGPAFVSALAAAALGPFSDSIRQYPILWYSQYMSGPITETVKARAVSECSV